MRTKSEYKLFSLMSIILPVLLVAGCSSNDGSGSRTVAHIMKSTMLIGAQEVPAVTNTTATGRGTFIVDPKTRVISGSVTTKDLTGTVAHIHTGVTGVSGPPVVMLAETTIGSGIWEVPTGTVLSAANYELFLDGGLYVNVHSDAHPKGEIRGQIGKIVRFASLTGAQEVPAVTNTTATGSGTFIVDSKTHSISGSVTTTGLTGTVAHIHAGATGVSGLPVEMLVETTTGSGIWEVPTGTVLSAANYKLFVHDGLYVNVHSDAHPKGEIRGQISIQ